MWKSHNLMAAAINIGVLFAIVPFHLALTVLGVQAIAGFSFGIILVVLKVRPNFND